MFFFKKKVPTIDSFRWDSSGWTFRGQNDKQREWENGAGDLVIQRFVRQVPTGIPLDWRDAESLRRYLATRRPPTLSTVSIDVIRFPTGVAGGQYVNKEFMPEPSHGFLYTGIVTMPFRDFFCNFLFLAPEHGTTGFRESVLMATGKVSVPEQKEIPVIQNEQELEAMYRKARAGAPQVTACDNEEFDAIFPKHPLSRLRGYLKSFRESLAVDTVVKGYAPFGT